MHDFLEAWTSFDPSNGATLLDGDEKVLAKYEKHTVRWDWSSFIQAFKFGEPDSRLHIGLLPQPFCGAIDSAKVVILTLNPGLNPIDYFAERRVPEFVGFREAVFATYKQRFLGRYPLMFLDPQFSWHSGFKYWHDKLSKLINQFALEQEIHRTKALEFFAQSVAVLELLPYHSANTPADFVQKLNSAKLACSYAHDVLLKKAKAKEVLLVVVRKNSLWKMPKVDGKVVVYEKSEPRASHLSLNSAGGPEILKKLAQVWRSR